MPLTMLWLQQPYAAIRGSTVSSRDKLPDVLLCIIAATQLCECIGMARSTPSSLLESGQAVYIDAAASSQPPTLSEAKNGAAHLRRKTHAHKNTLGTKEARLSLAIVHGTPIQLLLAVSIQHAASRVSNTSSHKSIKPVTADPSHDTPICPLQRCNHVSAHGMH